MSGFNIRQFQAAQRRAFNKEKAEEQKRIREMAKGSGWVFGVRPSRKKSSAGRATRLQNSWILARSARGNGKSPALLTMIHKAGLAGLQYGELQEGAIHLDSNLLSDTPQGRELEMVVDARRHPRVQVKNLFVHWSISLDPSLPGRTEAEWRDIARMHLQKCGFEGCQYSVVLHPRNESHGEHIHIVASRSKADGRLVSMSQSYWRFRAGLRQIELHFGLAPVERPADRPQAPTTRAVSAQRMAQRRNERDPWVDPRLIQDVLNTATSMKGLGQALAAKGIAVTPSKRKDGTVVGLLFKRDDAETALAGSTVNRRFSLPAVMRQLELNRQLLQQSRQQRVLMQRQHQAVEQRRRFVLTQQIQRPRER